MPDINMCRNKECPNKDRCYRFTAEPNSKWQTWAEFCFDEDTGECDDFIDNKRG